MGFISAAELLEFSVERAEQGRVLFLKLFGLCNGLFPETVI